MPCTRPPKASSTAGTVLLAGTNNYLGLTFDPECRAAAIKAVQELGTGTTGSRMASGNYAGHRALEREFADGIRLAGSAIVFSTGYQANLGAISALAGQGEYLMVDADSHASIHDACRLSTATTIRFRHNDPENLARRLERLGEDAKTTLVVVESLYSVLGDRAPLTEFVEVSRQHGAMIIVDEAHSFGMYRPEGPRHLRGAGTARSRRLRRGHVLEEPGWRGRLLRQPPSRSSSCCAWAVARTSSPPRRRRR